MAQSCHLGVIYKETDLTDAVFLSDSRPIPREAAQTFTVICDDFIGLSRQKEDALRLDRQLTTAYEKHHLQRHLAKGIAASLVGDVAGLRLHGDGALGPRPVMLFKMFRATLEALLRVVLAPRTLGKLIGTWTWVLLSWRPGLSILDSVYGFILPQAK